MATGSTLVPSYEAALAALGMMGAAGGTISLLMIAVWAFTGRRAAKFYATVFGAFAGIAVGTAVVSLAWSAVQL